MENRLDATEEETRPAKTRRSIHRRFWTQRAAVAATSPAPATRISSLDTVWLRRPAAAETLHRSRPLSHHPLEQALEATAIDAVALHQKANEGIFHQLGERAPRGLFVYDASPNSGRRYSSRIKE